VKIWVRAGPGFHAGDEFTEWARKKLGDDHATGVVGCLHQILDVRQYGFAGRRHMWQREDFANVWTFQSQTFRVAATIPGDGRAETFDLCLIASERTARSTRRGASKHTFVELIKSRLRTGSEEEFEL
jgi:hypothetical protein